MKKYIIIVLLFCANLINAQTTPGKYTIKNVNSVNTHYADFGASYFGTDSIVFSSPTKRKMIKNIWKPNEQPYLDLYKGLVGGNGEIIGKEKVKGVVNTKFHEAIVVFTKDLKTVYFTGNNYYKNEVKNDVKGVLKLQLFKASVAENGEWINVVKLPFNNDQYSTGHPALSEDGNKLYFISDRPESIGQTDIYVVDINADGTFSEPKNLGSKVNTKEKEVFPFISDEILYYSSEGNSGLGGLDIFAVRIYDNSVSKPLSLGIPINTINDDFAFIIKKDKGYLSSNREGGRGDDDIYSFDVMSPLKIECNRMIKGVVKNKNTQEILIESVVSLFDDKGNEIQNITTLDGIFNFEVACDKSYKVVGIKSYFEKGEENIEVVNEDGTVANVILNLTPKGVSEEERDINSIYFDLNKWNIRADAAIELDKMVELMRKYPNIIIESRSYTDSRGKDASNLLLSDRRAKSTVAYIVSKGIDASRISGKGFGEIDLLNDCADFVKCRKSQHQINRRTEFYIVDYKE